MKRCPECDSSFPGTDMFCELDGAVLVEDLESNPDLLVTPADERTGPEVSDSGEPLHWETDSQEDVVQASGDQHSREAGPGQNWKTLAIVAVAGIAVGIVVFIGYQQITREAPEQSPNLSANEAVVPQQGPVLPSRPAPIASASPSEEPSPSPTATPSPVSQTEPTRPPLSSSPVSTGGDKSATRGSITIRLADGNSVEADEVWETGEGIWYRRSGVVTLLERNQVKAIERPSPAPSPSATVATSPSASP